MLHVADMKIEKCASVLNVSDLTASFAWFKKIGREKYWGHEEPPILVLGKWRP